MLEASYCQHPYDSMVQCSFLFLCQYIYSKDHLKASSEDVRMISPAVLHYTLSGWIFII